MSETLLDRELRSLAWSPLDGARFVRAALSLGTPSVRLLEESTAYLSMYFQELDDAIGRSRTLLGNGTSPSVVAAELMRAIDSVEGVDPSPGRLGGAAWFEDEDAGCRFLERALREAGSPVTLGGTGPARAAIRLACPTGEPFWVGLSMQGDTVRLVAAHVVEMPPTGTGRRDLNLVNQPGAPGRAYPSEDGAGIDFSVGLPAPERPEGPFPLRPLLGSIVHDGVDPLRRGLLPAWSGAPVPDPGAALDRVEGWLRAQRADVTRLHGGTMCVVRTDTPAGRDVTVEWFVLAGSLLVARAAAVDKRPVAPSDAVFAVLEAWNRGAAAGAAVLLPDHHVPYGHASLPIALFPADDFTIGWLLARALEAADGALATAAPPA